MRDIDLLTFRQPLRLSFITRFLNDYKLNSNWVPILLPPVNLTGELKY